MEISTLARKFTATLCLVGAIAFTGAPSISLAASPAEDAILSPLALDSVPDAVLDLADEAAAILAKKLRS